MIAVNPLNEQSFDAVLNSSLPFDFITLNPSEKSSHFRVKPKLLRHAISRGNVIELKYGDAVLDPAKAKLFISFAKLIVRLSKGRNTVFAAGNNNIWSVRSQHDNEIIAKIASNSFKPINRNGHFEIYKKVVQKSVRLSNSYENQKLLLRRYNEFL